MTARHTTPGLRVLVVEDEALLAEYIAMVLEDSPHQVVGTAETGAEALQLAADLKPELALIDIVLHGPMDGLEVAARLRRRQPDVRIVFASGSHDPGTLARADTLQPDGFLKKPYLPKHLLQLLDQVSAERRTG